MDGMEDDDDGVQVAAAAAAANRFQTKMKFANLFTVSDFVDMSRAILLFSLAGRCHRIGVQRCLMLREQKK
jgi:hypothetical protein